MRKFLTGGILILGLGTFVLLQGANFTSRRDVLKLGGVKITAEQESIPPWVGGAAMAAGLALTVAGARKPA